MTTSLPALDPNLEEVLRDIAKDEKSTLFATTPKRFIQGVRALGAGLDQRHTTRSKPEQHLIRVHAAEVARAIRFWVYDWTWKTYSFDASPRLQRPEGPRHDLDSLTRQASGELTQDSADLIRLLVGIDGPGETPAVECPELQLLAIARSLESHPQLDSYLADALRRRSEFRTAARLASQTACRFGTAGIPSSAHFLALGTSLLHLGEDREGLQAFQTSVIAASSSPTPSRPNAIVVPALGLVLSGLASGDRAAVDSGVGSLAEAEPGVADGTMARLAHQWLRSGLGSRLRTWLNSCLGRHRTGSLQEFIDEVVR